MARINVEDSLFKDNRFFNLAMKLGSKTMALGAVVELYIVAQEYWKKDRSLIPKHIWVEQGLNNTLIEVSFVEEKDHGFYVKNSDQLFDWLLSKVKNGRRGGLANKKGSSNDFNNLESSESKRMEAIESESKPLTPTPTLINKIKNIKKTKDPSLKLELIEICNLYPNPEGLPSGIEKICKKIKTREDLELFKKSVLNYRDQKQNSEIQYIKTFSNFIKIWRDYINPANFTQKRPATLFGMDPSL